MYPKTFTHRLLFATTLRSLLVFTVVFMWMAGSAFAQSTSASSGSTPTGLKPGAPAGSYALSGFENVNLFNGNLSFSLPQLKIGGRGGAGMPVTVSLNSVKWTVEKYDAGEQESSSICASGHANINGCNYQPFVTNQGWSTEAFLYPNPEPWDGLRVGYGPGVLQGRYTANTMGPVTASLIRLTFTAPDGTEYELVDKATNGRPYGASGFGWQPPSDHGLVYKSDDGAVTFLPDEQIQYVFGHGTGLVPTLYMTGYLLLADGTRYRIENGLVIWKRDRNGNQLTFTYYGTTSSPPLERRVNTITDSLGRVTTIYYANEETAYDRITFTGFGGTAQQEIQVYRKQLSQALRTTRTGDETSPQTFGYLFADLLNGGGTANPPGYTFNPGDVISEIKLPDNRSYKLYYNVYNELARLELPTGGAIEYDYTPRGSSVYWASSGPQIHRRVTERRLYSDSTSSSYESRQTYTPTFTVTAYSGNYPTFWETTVEVKQYGGSDLINSEKHTFFWSPIASMYKAPVSYSGWKDGKEKKVEYLNAQGTVLRRVENTWQQCDECLLDKSWWTPTSMETTDHAPSNNPHISATVMTLMDVSPNLVSKQTFEYDMYGNLTDTYDYDYHVGEPAAHPVRHIKTDYLTTNNSIDYTATNVHLRGLPTMQRVYSVNPANGTETLAAKSETVYDETTYQVTESYTTLTGWTAPATAARGNATTSRAWYDVNSSNAYIETHVQYDQCGNMRKTWDGRGKVSEIDYSSTYNYALPTHTKSPPAVSTGSELETTSVYDFSTGLVTLTIDANNQETDIEYNDLLSRPTRVTRPGGGWTSFEYGDTVGNLYVRTQTALDASRTLEAYQYFDGLGRAWRSSQTEGATSILADTQYDALGRVWKMSNPYRTGDTVQWTTTTYDALGRVTSVKTPDDAEVVTAYSANTVTVTDQAGKQRKSVTDALGRLTSVYEAPNDTTYFNFQTSYLYDVLGNLRTVTQGSQKRYFLYDSLSRLIRARNPEQDTNTNLNLSSDALTENNNQWSISYTYDNNGNLLTKTDARSMTTTFTYDDLNRITQRRYDNGTAVATPTVNYTYDDSNVSNSKGRLTSVSSSVSAYNYTSYDAVGRVTGSQQVTDGQTYSMSYSYDLAGNMTSQTYPTGRVVTQSFDGGGRLASISGQASGETPKTYANAFGYSAHGAVERMRLGNGRWEHTNFNNRLQPTEIGLGTSANDSSVLKLNYEYGTTANDANVLKQIITVPTIGSATGFTATQHYQYDQLNRLTGAQEVNGTSSGWQSSGALWQQKFSYDRYGNRAVDTANTTSTMIGPNPQIGTSSNRIVPRASPVEYYEYDAAGNMKKGQSGDTLAYDAENKLVQYQGGATQSGGANYYYDGDGKRVKKAKPSETLIFVYNIGGQLVAEYTTSTPQSNGTSYLTGDTLGSPRALTRADGSIRARHDYLPFGEELYANAGNRTTGQKYDDGASPADKTRQRFTQKERDNETGLDYFGARYYASAQGRFTSLDPKMLGIKQVVNPQRWNRYAYVVNNPLALYDPDGQDDQGQAGSKIIDVFIAIPPDRQQDYRTDNGKPAGKYPVPDWSKLQGNAAKAGYTVNVHQLSESTPEAVASSYKNAELTVIVGHGIDMDPANPTKFTADAAAISGGLVSDGGIQPATVDGGKIIATGEATPVSGTGVVGLFTCNSTDVLSSAFPNQTVVSNDGGTDGLTTVGTLQQSAFGFVGTYVDTGGNVNAAVATGQRVINNASNRVVNERAPNGSQATNSGDKLHVKRPDEK